MPRPIEQRVRSGLVRKLFVLVVKLSIGLAILYWLTASGRFDYKVYGQLVEKRSGVFILGAMLTQMLAILLPQFRWWLLVRALNIPLTLIDILKLGFAGSFASILVPGMVGYEGVRIWFLRTRHPDKTFIGISTMVLDRLIGMIALFGLGTLCGMGLLLMSNSRWTGRLLLVSVPVLALLVVILGVFCGFLPQVGMRRWRRFHWVDEAVGAWEVYQGQRWVLTSSLLLSFGAQISKCISVCFGLLAIGKPLLILGVFTVTPVVALVRSIPLTPLGLGVSDAAAAELFTLVGMSGGAEVHMLGRGISVLLCLVSGLVFLHRWRPSVSVESSPVETAGK